MAWTAKLMVICFAAWLLCMEHGVSAQTSEHEPHLLFSGPATQGSASQPRRLPPVESTTEGESLYGRMAATQPLRQQESAAAEAASEKPEEKQQEGKSDDKKQFGEAPVDNSRIFLRQSAVLLKPGVMEVEWGLNYTLQERSFLAILPDASLVQEVTDKRAVFGTLSLRYGLSDRWQPYTTLPVGVGHFERATVETQVDDVSFGLGDLSAGCNYLLRDGDDEETDIVLGLGFVAPTGNSEFASISPDTTPLGDGFWTTIVNVNFIRTYDPVVVFYSIGHNHRFGRDYFGVEVEPGEAITYGMGVGFAVNDDVTLSCQYQSELQFDTRIDRHRIPDSSVEASLLRNSIIFRTCDQAFIETFVTFGLTDDSPQTSIGILSTRRY